MPSQRKQRVQHLLRNEISTIMLRKLKDPRVQMATISEVDVSPDLKSAKVWVSVYGDAERQGEVIDGLRSASGFIRAELMKVLDMRPIPFLSFELDTSLARAAHTLDVLDQVRHEQPHEQPESDAGAEPGDPTDPAQ